MGMRLRVKIKEYGGGSDAVAVGIVDELGIPVAVVYAGAALAKMLVDRFEAVEKLREYLDTTKAVNDGDVYSDDIRLLLP